MASLLRARWLHVTFAFLAMGGWALFANRGHEGAWLAALTQGLASAVITFVLKGVLDRMGGRFTSWRAFVLPPLSTATAVLIALWVAHTGIGTPNVLATIAVPWSVSTLYAILYAADVERRNDRA